ncbi:biotin carboxylase N-terminal domain-containing protein [Nonomuraea sp. NPDC048916]|uniref:acetyl/propionyl/methylcrotonyl-CoA carboxylase subunit alpha n=1 Tax=Nonomuraea sp. NPDC048916 TaxID=3154232 RepID=UPI00340F77AE
MTSPANSSPASPASSTPEPLFGKVLVANRGEIAVRVIRACRDLGIRSVAVHSAADAGALHVRLADEAYALPGTSPADTYLNVELIMKVLAESQADAVHPGYGFLSESTALAEAVIEAGREFVGPGTEAIAVMGSKVSARKAAAAAGVPLVPGSDGPVASGDDVRAFAARHGYPITVKASYGGGGRGMRIVRDDAEADDAVAAARREAQAYFGQPEIYLERYLERPRHVEVQIIADRHGAVVSAGNRDCTVQRRHQKLIEEAPCTVISEATRQAMDAAAVALAASVGYVGAGTVEFLVEDDAFYFLEMNTRLQVEHPVTELVTGIDLVAEQLRVAAGLPLSFGQADVAVRGHALEMRINAEDPADGLFRPTPGTVAELRPPLGYGVRFDSGYEAGDVVSEYYDGLLGKLVVHAKDRPSAIARALRALEELRVAGVATTRPAHLAVLRHPVFTADSHHTTWLETDAGLKESLASPAPETRPAEAAAEPDRSIVLVAGREHWIPFHAERAAGVAAAPATAPPPSASGPRRAAGMSGSSDGIVRAPMQGTIAAVSARVGAEVGAGDVVCVLEAMKMENPVTAGKAGRVTEIRVAVGAGVSPGDTLVVIE